LCRTKARVGGPATSAAGLLKSGGAWRDGRAAVAIGSDYMNMMACAVWIISLLGFTAFNPTYRA